VKTYAYGLIIYTSELNLAALEMDADFINKLKTMMDSVEDIKKTVASTDTTVKMFASEISGLKQENIHLKKKVVELEQRNIELESKFNDLDQYSRINNVIISGIPYTEGENIRFVVKDIANQLQVDIEDYDICTAHQLRAPKDEIPSIIVRLNNRDKKICL